MNLEAEFTERAPFLRALARRLADDQSTAEDLVQETCVAALTGATARPRGLAAWWHAVLRRRAARRIRGEQRRRSREQAVARSPLAEDTVTVVHKLDVARRLLVHVQALEPAYRDAIFLRFYENLKPQQIADRIGVPVGTVKTRLVRALLRLRERLDADHPDGRRDWLPALAAIGGLQPHAAGALPQPATGRTALLHRGGIALGVVTIATVAFGVAAWRGAFDAPTPAIAGPAATARSAAADDPSVRREPLTAAAEVLVGGRVEDAAIGAEPGFGMPAANVVVRCRVQQPSGPGAAGADAPAADPTQSGSQVRLRRPTAEFVTTTDAEGRFQMELPAGSTPLALVAEGSTILRAAHWSAAEAAAASAAPPAPIVLTRYPHGPIAGTVMQPSGTVVGGARVTLCRRQDGDKVAIETSADQNGYFVFPQCHPDCWLAAAFDGCMQIGSPQLEPLPRGGWRSAIILLAPVGTLAVEIVDSTGRPARHVEGIGAALAFDEAGLFATTNCTPGNPILARAPATAGMATLSVPAGLDLALLVDQSLFVREQNGQGVARDAEPSVGQPIRVDAGRQRRLRLTIGTDLVLAVVVVDPDGRPVPDATIWFERVSDGRRESIRMANTDANGQFELPLAAADADQAFVINVHGAGPSEGLQALRQVRIGGAESTRIELRLAPPRQLTGQVRGADNEVVGAQVRYLFRNGGDSEWVGDRGYDPTDAAGKFRVTCMPDAEHRLVIASDGFATAILDDVRPGAPIDVVLQRGKRIRLLTGKSSTPIADLRVRIGYLEAAGAVDPGWPELLGNTAWSLGARHELSTVPMPQQIQKPEGIWRFEEIGPLRPHGDPAGSTYEFYLDGGPALLSVSGRDNAGEPLSRLTTGPVTIGEEGVELPLALLPTATCRGRIRFRDGSERVPVCVALADDAGRLLMVSVLGNEAWETVAACSSHGHFALGAVPVGTWELRVGTRLELTRGEARQRQRVVIGDGREEPILITL